MRAGLRCGWDDGSYFALHAQTTLIPGTTTGLFPACSFASFDPNVALNVHKLRTAGTIPGGAGAGGQYNYTLDAFVPFSPYNPTALSATLFLPSFTTRPGFSFGNGFALSGFNPLDYLGGSGSGRQLRLFVGTIQPNAGAASSVISGGFTVLDTTGLAGVQGQLIGSRWLEFDPPLRILGDRVLSEQPIGVPTTGWGDANYFEATIMYTEAPNLRAA